VSEGVEILISADDQASRVIDKAAGNVDEKVKRIKAVGQGAKASTEFIGSLARSLGGSALASYASGIAQITEKIGAFSEVSKAGAGGAIAFRAGIAGVAAVAGFKVGTMIGNLVFETERWTKQISEANKLLEESSARLARIEAVRLSFRVEKAELSGETESRQLLNELTEEGFALEKQIEETKAKQLKANEGLAGWATFLTGQSASLAEANAADLAVYEEKLAVINKEKEALQAKLSPYAAELQALRESVALKKRNESYIAGLQEEVDLLKASEQQQAAVMAMQKAGGDAQAAAKIESLLREKESIEAQKQAAKEAEKLLDLKNKELAKLEEQRIALMEGKEAAHAFALEQQGLDKAVAERIAREQAAIDKQQALQGFKRPELNAFESRLLTRGPAEKGIDKVAKNTEESVKQLKQIKEKLPLSSSESLRLEFVS
jgi:hypothetical protein